MQKRLRLSEQAPVLDRPWNDFSQHIYSAFVLRQHTIGNQKSRRAGMISNHSQGSSGFLLGWADEGVRPYVVRAAACVGAGALTRPAERSSATSFRDCCRAALGLDGRDARPSMGIACPRADGGVRRYVVFGS